MNAPHADGYRWVILGLAWLAFFGTWLSRMAYPPLIPEVSQQFQLSFAEAGLLMTGWWVGYQSSLLPGGFAADRLGARKTFLAFVTLTGLLTVLTGFSQDFSQFLAFRLLSGFFAGFLFAATAVLIIRWFPSRSRAVAFGIFQTSWTAGLVVSATAAPALALALGEWRWAFWVLGLPLLALSLANFHLLRRSSPPADNTEGGAVGGRPNYALIFRSPRMWFLILVSFGTIYSIGVTVTWTPTFLVEVYGATLLLGGSLLSFFAVGGVFGSLWGGFLADRVLRRRGPLFFLASVLVGVAGIGLALHGFGGLFLVVAMVLLVGFASNIVMTLAPPIFSRWLPLNIVGTASGFWNFLGGLGAIAAPFTTGLILDATGSFQAAWLSMAVIALALSAFALPLMRGEK